VDDVDDVHVVPSVFGERLVPAVASVIADA
jgi:hypothetical protein